MENQEEEEHVYDEEENDDNYNSSRKLSRNISEGGDGVGQLEVSVESTHRGEGLGPTIIGTPYGVTERGIKRRKSKGLKDQDDPVQTGIEEENNDDRVGALEISNEEDNEKGSEINHKKIFYNRESDEEELDKNPDNDYYKISDPPQKEGKRTSMGKKLKKSKAKGETGLHKSKISKVYMQSLTSPDQKSIKGTRATVEQRPNT